MMKFLGIIPSRFGSTRFEGKPLVDIMGKPMIQHVYERAEKAIPDLYVATDDKRIHDTVEGFGGRVIMTSPEHTTGTSRCLEAYEKISHNSGKHFDVIINVQGDEPLLDPASIETLKACFTDEYIMMATLATALKDPEDLESVSDAFVVFDKDQNALYFSRAPIPFVRGIPRREWLAHYTIYRHIGIYGYTPEALEIFSTLKQSRLELAEGLEQNRWLENGHAIRIGLTDHQSLSIDTPDDLERLLEFIKQKQTRN